MRAYLTRHLGEDLVGAYVHGSLGTGEEIAYSDFDALVILKDAVFEHPKRLARVAQRLYRARRIMKAFDPLQHHGWFVLAEAQLAAYPEYYFPRVLFQHARSLLPGRGEVLSIRVQADDGQAVGGFMSLSTSIINRLGQRQYPPNMYELKFLLSQVMLMPALYLQARDGRGVFKKDSFEQARVDFAPEDWAVMEEVSALRAAWHYELSCWQRWLLTRLNRGTQRFAKRFAPSIPAELRAGFTDALYDRIKYLAMQMQEQVSPKKAGARRG